MPRTLTLIVGEANANANTKLINRPTDRLTHQHTKRPTDQRTNRPTDRTTNQPTDQPTNEPPTSVQICNTAKIRPVKPRCPMPTDRQTGNS